MTLFYIIIVLYLTRNLLFFYYSSASYLVFPPSSFNLFIDPFDAVFQAVFLKDVLMYDILYISAVVPNHFRLVTPFLARKPQL